MLLFLVLLNKYLTLIMTYFVPYLLTLVSMICIQMLAFVNSHFKSGEISERKPPNLLQFLNCVPKYGGKIITIIAVRQL